MTLKLYSFIGDNKLSDKSNNITLIETLEGNLKENTSFQTPSILIKLGVYEYITDGTNYVYGVNSKLIYYNDQFDNIITANYCYITEFNRYYYIVDRQISVTGLLRLDLREDVLFTYDSSIRALSGFVSRNENTYNAYVKDDLISYYYNKEVTESEPTNGVLATTTFNSNVSVLSNTMTVTVISNQATTPTTTSTPPADILPTVGSWLTGLSLGSVTYTTYPAMISILLKRLIDLRLNDNDLDSYVLSIVAYPFAITSSATEQDLTIAETTLSESGDLQAVKVQALSSKASPYMTIADFTYSATSFFDYEPFTTYEIYLPYVGWISISANDFLNKRIIVTYAVNYQNGSAQVSVCDITSNKLIYTSSAQLGAQIPVNSTNSLEIEKNKLSNNISLGVGLASSTIAIIGGAISQNPIAVAGGVISAGSSIANYVKNESSNFSKAYGTVSAGSFGLYLPQNVRIRKTCLKPKNYDSNYASLFGLPLNEYVSLSSLTGYTVLGDIQLSSGFEGASETEKNEIISLLKSGIIL